MKRFLYSVIGVMWICTKRCRAYWGSPEVAWAPVPIYRTGNQLRICSLWDAVNLYLVRTRGARAHV